MHGSQRSGSQILVRVVLSNRGTQQEGQGLSPRSEGPKGQEGPVRTPRKGSKEGEGDRDGLESGEPGKDVCRRGLGSRAQGG